MRVGRVVRKKGSRLGHARIRFSFRSMVVIARLEKIVSTRGGGGSHVFA